MNKRRGRRGQRKNGREKKCPRGVDGTTGTDGDGEGGGRREGGKEDGGRRKELVGNGSDYVHDVFKSSVSIRSDRRYFGASLLCAAWAA